MTEVRSHVGILSDHHVPSRAKQGTFAIKATKTLTSHSIFSPSFVFSPCLFSPGFHLLFLADLCVMVHNLYRDRPQLFTEYHCAPVLLDVARSYSINGVAVFDDRHLRFRFSRIQAVYSVPFTRGEGSEHHSRTHYDEDRHVRRERWPIFAFYCSPRGHRSVRSCCPASLLPL